MTFDVEAFRTSFPEFSDAVVYPTTMVAMWAGFAERQIRPEVWKDSQNLGVSLFVAHEITLGAQNTKTSRAGGMPGTSGGVANTKTVGSVTVGYDSITTGEKNAGHWNLTNYGKQLFRLARQFGAGVVQL